MLLRIFACVFLAPMALQAQARPAEDCAASGTVVNAITGEPIPKATVTTGVTIAGVPHSGATTDAAGKWTITNTTCGAGSPTATHAGFIDGHYQPVPGSGSSHKTIELVSGSPLHDLKIALMPEAVVSGRVQDPDGDPIAGAQIRLLRVSVWNGRRQLSPAARTSSDAQGSFRIESLAAGRYLVCAESRQITYPVGGGGIHIYRDDCYPGPESTGLSSAAPVEGGHEFRATLTLAPVPGVHVRGKVSGGALVRLLHANGDVTSYTANADRDGSFELHGVPPGSWLIEATTPSERPGAIRSSVRVPIEIGNSDVNGVTLSVQPPGSVSGTVRFELSHSAAGAASSAVSVMIASPQNDSGDLRWDASHLNFEYPEVQHGKYQLYASSSALGTYVKSATFRGQDVMNQPLSVEGPTGPIEIVVSDDTGDIAATVTDADGRPASGAVVLMPRAGTPIVVDAGDDGKAAMKNIPPGEYKAWAFDNPATVPYTEDEWMTQNAGLPQKVTVTTAGTANVTLKRIAAPSE